MQCIGQTIIVQYNTGPNPNIASIRKKKEFRNVLVHCTAGWEMVSWHGAIILVFIQSGSVLSGSFLSAKLF